MADGLYCLGPDAIISSNHDDCNVGDASATGTHGAECLQDRANGAEALRLAAQNEALRLVAQDWTLHLTVPCQPQSSCKPTAVLIHWMGPI